MFGECNCPESEVGQPPEAQYIAESGISRHDLGQIPGCSTNCMLLIGLGLFLFWQFGVRGTRRA